MGLGSKLKALLDVKGIKVSTLADDLNINRNTFYSLIQRDSDKMDMDTLSRVAEYLGESVDYYFVARDVPSYTSDEEQLMVDYRRLPASGKTFIRQAVDITLKAYCGTTQKKPERKRARTNEYTFDPLSDYAAAHEQGGQSIDDINDAGRY